MPPFVTFGPPVATSWRWAWPEIRKNFILEVVMTFFEKFQQNLQLLKFRSRISSLKSRSRSFNGVLVSKVTVSTISSGNLQFFVALFFLYVSYDSNEQ